MDRRIILRRKEEYLALVGIPVAAAPCAMQILHLEADLLAQPACSLLREWEERKHFLTVRGDGRIGGGGDAVRVVPPKLAISHPPLPHALQQASRAAQQCSHRRTPDSVSRSLPIYATRNALHRQGYFLLQSLAPTL